MSDSCSNADVEFNISNKSTFSFSSSESGSLSESELLVLEEVLNALTKFEPLSVVVETILFWILYAV